MLGNASNERYFYRSSTKKIILLPEDFLDGTGVFHFDMGGVVYF